MCKSLSESLITSLGEISESGYTESKNGNFLQVWDNTARCFPIVTLLTLLPTQDNRTAVGIVGGAT